MHEPKKIRWYKIADKLTAINWGENNLTVAEVAGKKITLARTEKSVFACAQNCPHASGTLADGFIDNNGNIVCPLHGYRFNLKNGRNITGEGYFLKTYFTDVREDGVYVGFEEKNVYGQL